MELFIKLHDHADVVHNEFQYELDSQDTFKQLKEKFHSEWNINIEKLQLFFEDEQKLNGLGEKSIQSFSLKRVEGRKRFGQVLRKSAKKVIFITVALILSVVGFRQADEVDMTDDQMSQRELIHRILVLKDLHSANYGVDCKGGLSIIDFKVCDNYGKAEKYWVGEDRTERQRVARLCFESWQLEPMIIQANDSIFQQKELFRKNGIQCKPSRDFDIYLAQIRKNIIYISSSL